ncbi:hypothetical protein DXX93_01675 [Thalassotalea euphylliae]|uniref:Periplasmic binding protein domain-containing protein n=1 Tax=Thalassotalea euphylliae TaxID=1655234 RepID=A0A3E0TMK1_9GAMM|nr:ABC transporter substrate-binding protein [Thalassotalea euphylliae]REL25382.1 hypothetical protein DXX93_01675 [Thalassotalea euphylliae]
MASVNGLNNFGIYSWFTISDIRGVVDLVMKRFSFWLLIMLLAIYSQLVVASQFKVVVINPGSAKSDTTGPFWANVHQIMQAAADDLDIELVSLFAERNHIKMKALAVDALALKPDYVIIVNEKGVGIELVRVFAKNKIPVFALLNGFNDKERESLSESEQKSLIGSVVPDNRKAGEHLLSELISLHENTSDSINLLALRGDFASAAATEREHGLQQALSVHKQVRLIDYPVGNWSKGQAYTTVKGILQRARVDIIWSANDPMAFGALEAVQEANLSYPVTVGGMNWDETNLNSTIDVSLGGHVVLGAKALAMLADYHQKDLKPCEMNVVIDIFQSSLAGNMRRFLENIADDSLSEIDFSRFSQAHAETALFSLETFISHTYLPLPSEPLTDKALLKSNCV